MSKVVRCYRSKRRVIVDKAAIPKASSCVSAFAADALQFGDGSIKHVKASNLVNLMSACM